MDLSRAFLGASQDDRFLLSSHSAIMLESLLFHHLDFIRQTGRNHILITPYAHPDVIHALKKLEPLGIVTKTVPVNSDGQLSINTLREWMGPRASLLLMPLADGMTGVIQPLAEIAALCSEKTVRLHLDVTAVIGKLEIDFKQMGVDLLSFQLQADGPCCLLAKSGIDFQPIMPSIDQEAISKFNEDLQKTAQQLDHFCTEIARLRAHLEQGIKQQLPDATICFATENRLPNCSMIQFADIDCEALSFLLFRKGIFSNQHSSVISFTLSATTTQQEIDLVIDAVTQSVHQLKQIGAQL
jgi:cysteine desulfurase